MSEFEGRVALITGAAQGIGRAVAEKLAAAGVRVAVSDINGEAAESTALEIGTGHRGYRLDVADSTDVDAVVERVVADFGRLDILVNNAGISLVGPAIVNTTDDMWQRSIAVMQSGVFYCMRAVGRRFIAQRSGSCVNVSSIRGFSPRPGRLAYSTTKAAVLMMTKIAAGEWAPYGVRCNAIAPGVQRTPMWDEDVKRGVVDEARVLRMTPAGRLGEPSEIGDLVLYLSSDAASFINGATVTIDGALTMIPPDGEVIRPGSGLDAGQT